MPAVNPVLFGWVGDRLPSQKMPFILGLGLLASSTIVFGLGSTSAVLLISRLLQGLSSAVVFTFGRTLLLARVGHERIGRAMGFTGMATSIGLLAGPVIGGVLYQYGGHLMVFMVPSGCIIADMVLRVAIIERKNALQTSSIRDGYNGNGSVERMYTYEIDGTAGVEAAREEHDSNRPISADERLTRASGEEQPLLPEQTSGRHAYLILITSPRFLAAVLSIFLLNSIGNGLHGILPVYCKDTLNLPSSQLAPLFLAMAVPSFASPLSGVLADRFGPKWPASAGISILVTSLSLLQLATPGSKTPYLILIMSLFFSGLGITQATTPLQTDVSASIKAVEDKSPGVFGPHGAYSQGYGLMSTAFAAGAMLGPFYAGFVRVWLGWSLATESMSVLAAITLFLVVSLTGGNRPFLTN